MVQEYAAPPQIELMPHPWRSSRSRGLWTIEHRHGKVSELLNLEEPDSDQLVARMCSVSNSALVIGSSQSLSTVDQARSDAFDIEVIRRRSGGGAVLVTPYRQVWFDFFVPAGATLWEDDITKAAIWAGELWASVSALFVNTTPTVHGGRLIADRWGKLVCFAGVGPGEVLIAGRKAVGLSQRRNRYRAHIQTAALVTAAEGNPQDELELLSLTPEERIKGRGVLESRCCVLSADATTVADSLLDALGVD